MDNEEQKIHWADKIAEELISENDKEQYIVASGITPSGVVHIGNFRETITSDLVVKALLNKGKKVKFIYSWDNYDVFRKVPLNMPKQDELKKWLRHPIVDVFDPFEKENSYARHNEVAVEKYLPIVGVNPEFISQAEKYRNCEYADQIKTSMQKRKEIKKILDKYRKDPLEENWFPTSIFCKKCNTDQTKIIGYDEEYSVKYSCKCGFEEEFDIRKSGIIKLLWRIDWPMRWAYEGVDFEPSGKEHSSAGGSNTTAEQIVKEIWNKNPPKHIMYEFISIKGMGGKMSSSKGNTINLEEMLGVYSPELVRYIFATRLPKKYFEISFEGMDVFRLYSEFQKLERIYFKTEDCSIEDLELNNRIYELSSIEIKKEIPSQIDFRHLTSLIQIFQGDKEKIKKQLEVTDELYFEEIFKRANYWLENYAEEQFKFSVQENVSKEVIDKLTPDQKNALVELASKMDVEKEEEIIPIFKSVADNNNLNLKDFFGAAYLVLINKNFGPQLSGFIFTIGKDKVKELFSKLK